MIVEALVNLSDIGDEKNWMPGEIVMVRPVDWDWGVGDLQSRIVVRIDMPDFPCGADFFVNRKCVNCEHQGITWPSEPNLTDGDIGAPKTTCIKEQFEAYDNDFIFSFNPQGIPVLTVETNRRRMGNVIVESVLSAESLTKIKNEKSVTVAERDERLATARLPENLVTMDKLQVK